MEELMYQTFVKNQRHSINLKVHEYQKQAEVNVQRMVLMEKREAELIENLNVTYANELALQQPSLAIKALSLKYSPRTKIAPLSKQLSVQEPQTTRGHQEGKLKGFSILEPPLKHKGNDLEPDISDFAFTLSVDNAPNPFELAVPDAPSGGIQSFINRATID